MALEKGLLAMTTCRMRDKDKSKGVKGIGYIQLKPTVDFFQPPGNCVLIVYACVCVSMSVSLCVCVCNAHLNNNSAVCRSMAAFCFLPPLLCIFYYCIFCFICFFFPLPSAVSACANCSPVVNPLRAAEALTLNYSFAFIRQINLIRIDIVQPSACFASLHNTKNARRSTGRSCSRSWEAMEYLKILIRNAT